MPGVGSKWFPDTPDGHREAKAYGRANPSLVQREGTGAHVLHFIREQEERSLEDPEFDKTAAANPFPPGTFEGFLDELHKIAARVHDDSSMTGWERASESPGKVVHQTNKSHEQAKKNISHKGRRLASDLINKFDKSVASPLRGAANRTGGRIDKGLEIGEKLQKNVADIKRDGVRVRMGM